MIPWLKSKSLLNLKKKKKNPHLYKTQPAAGKNQNRVFQNFINELAFHTADVFLPYSGVALKFVFICG